MKKKIERLLIKLVKGETFWKILKPISTVGIILHNARLIHENNQSNKTYEQPKSKYDHLFDSLTVLNGPFKGLKYPSLYSVGSVIFPKLLGSYESELHPIVTSLFETDYSEILDVGCAEGYYAIGLARKYKAARVYAFDLNDKARKLCKEMAELNDVSSNIKVGSDFTPERLGSFKFTKRGLIICDCEGFESKLFNNENIKNLRHCDLIIEAHDFIDIEISGNLKKLFSNTHTIESIYSKDDIYKARNYYYSELAALSLNDKKELLAEKRPVNMEWIVCRAKE